MIFQTEEEQLANEGPSAPVTTPTTMTSSLPVTSSSTEISSVKDVIFNYRKELHLLYQRGDDLTSEQLESMAKGLSCILDLGEPEKEGTLRCLFSEAVWAKLVTKFSRLETTPLAAYVSLMDKWGYIVYLFNLQNGTRAKRLNVLTVKK